MHGLLPCEKSPELGARNYGDPSDVNAKLWVRQLTAPFLPASLLAGISTALRSGGEPASPTDPRPATSPDFSPRLWKGGALQAAEKPYNAVILRSSGDEESRIALKMLRARSFAALRMTAL